MTGRRVHRLVGLRSLPRCHYCGLRIADREKKIESNNTAGVWAHVTCWYHGGPFEREAQARESSRW